MSVAATLPIAALTGLTHVAAEIIDDDALVWFEGWNEYRAI